MKKDEPAKATKPQKQSVPNQEISHAAKLKKFMAAFNLNTKTRKPERSR